MVWHCYKTLDRFMNTLKNDIKSYNNNFELLCKHYIGTIKRDLMIPNVLCHMLFCKRFCDQNIDCRKCS